ncbi:MAG: single-stranded DNA-binding protein [Patescibacteria group bacterium]|jgi:single-strand DNA-binding protein
MNINKAIICGRITHSPEQKALPNGTTVANFTVVSNHNYKDKNGAKQEIAEFHRVTVYGKSAENCAQYLTKGQEVFVEGRIQTQSWEKDGVKHYRTEIIAERVQFGAKPKGDEGNAASGAKPSAKTATAPKKAQSATDDYDTINYPTEDINPDDIPF